ncbi:hypothetical protein C7M30_02702 [Bacillus subtilis]|nr:hypothetical protein C7M30_02702 [Bacillus subtilis]
MNRRNKKLKSSVLLIKGSYCALSELRTYPTSKVLLNVIFLS